MKLGAFFLSAALGLAASQVQAAVTIFSGQDDGVAVGGSYTNSAAAETSFLAAAAASAPAHTVILSEDFETIPTGPGPGFNSPAGLISISGTRIGNGASGVSDFTFGTTQGGVPNTYGFDIGTGAGRWLGFPRGAGTFAWGAGAYAFGFYATGVQSIFSPVFTLSYFDDQLGTSSTLNLPINQNGGVSYFGFIETVPFNRVVIARGGNEFWGLDNFSAQFTGTPGGFIPGGAVPEPSAWALMILGFGVAGAVMRRRKASAAAA